MSFNRSQKRVAGPGFYINVRYDDYHTRRCKQTKHTPEVLNKGARIPEIFDIKEQELLVTRKAGSVVAHYHDGYTHCFSAANHFPFPKSVNDFTPEGVKAYILDQVQFVGVATTEYKPTPGFQEQGFVAQVGGVTTLLNESGSNIYPGDKVMLDVNLSWGRKLTREKGIPREKVRFTVARAIDEREMIAEAVKGLSGDDGTDEEFKRKIEDNRKQIVGAKKAIRAANGDEAKVQEAKNLLMQLQNEKAELIQKQQEDSELCNSVDKLGVFLQRYRGLHDRVIGKSYSFARPGDRLEVGLQPRNPF